MARGTCQSCGAEGVHLRGDGNCNACRVRSKKAAHREKVKKDKEKDKDK